jgi:poly(3-hydroxybutyrate) depolymerase
MVPYDGGPLGDPFNPVKPVFPAIGDFVANWAERNRCAASPVESPVAPDVTRLEYPDCAEGAAVVFHTIQGGRPLMARRQAAAGMVGRAHQQQY